MPYLLTFVFVLLTQLTLYAQTSTFRNHAVVKSTNGYPELWLNNKRTPPFAYMSYLGASKYYEEVSQQGITIFCLPAYLGDQGINAASGIKPFRPSFWTGPHQYDFEVIRKEFETLTRVAKQAKVIMRVHLDAPQWWQRLYPTEVSLQPSGEPLRVSFSSEQWRNDAGHTLRALLDWIRQSEFNANLVGIHVAGGGTEEWFYHYSDRFYDESAARKKHFNAWLRKHYQDNEALLRTTWQQPQVTFDNATLADLSGFTKSAGLLHPQKDAWLLDSYAFHTDVMVDNIEYFTNIVKEHSKGRLLTGAFYGYHLFVHDPRRGHGALGKLLQCPTLDYLSSPNDYKRQAGLDWMPMAAIKSVQLHGKLWLAENDTRTHLTRYLSEVAPHINPPGNWYNTPVWKGPASKELSESYLWKNAGRILAYGYGGWWFDMWGGWFSDPDLLSVFKKLQQLASKYPITHHNSSHHYRPEVALVVDEKLAFYDASMGQLTATLLNNRYAMGNTGTPFDVYLRSDLQALSQQPYKVIWYLGLHALSEEEQALIKQQQTITPISLVTNEIGTTILHQHVPVNRYESKLSWTADELRPLFARAGVHLFNTQGDVIYAGNGWLTLHSVATGKRKITLPKSWKLTDVKTGKTYKANDTTITVDATKGETFLFRVR